jgi:hypothetical protein
MNFTLEGRILKYVDENTILIYKNGGVWKNKPKWDQLSFCTSCQGYYVINIGKKSFKVHRIIAYLFLGLDIYDTTQFIDHVDRDRQNNNIDNLRIVTNQQNQFNTNSKGYCYHKITNNFQARIAVNRKNIHLGYFDTAEEAHQVYLDAKRTHHAIP